MASLPPHSPDPPATRHIISCSRLRPGMFLVRVLDGWWKSPLFIHRRIINAQDIRQLIQAGIREAEIDITQGRGLLDSIQMPPQTPSMGQDKDEGLRAGDRNNDARETRSIEDAIPDRDPLEGLMRLRNEAVAALEEIFEGAKTGSHIPLPVLQGLAREFILRALAHPSILSDVVLIEQLERFHKDVYSHGVDTAVLTILVGLQLEWEQPVLEEVAVAALLHDVGFMRLPLNLVQAEWDGPGGAHERVVLQQHVEMGVRLLQTQSPCPPAIIHLIRDHHRYQDGSGYGVGQVDEAVCSAGALLGLVDYCDELLSAGKTSGSIPAALVIRRMYQESQKGKFPVLHMEALVRVLGVYPTGTVVRLSTGEEAVVVRQNPEARVKPYVKKLTHSGSSAGVEFMVNPEHSHLDDEDDVRICKILNAVHPSHLRHYFP